MTTMSAQGNYYHPGFYSRTSGRTAHKMPLVSPKIDVDVTGYSFKNLGTQLIDHPRDEGQRHREQLFNFQQRYRGATLLKLRGSSCGVADDKKPNDNKSDDTADAESGQSQAIRRSSSEHSSLATRFKKRLQQKNTNVSGSRSVDPYQKRSRSKSGPMEAKENESNNRHQQIKIQRMYSSGLIVKNNLYNQLREGDGKSNDTFQDSSKIVESLQKYGPGLERLPDIQYPGGKSFQHSKQLRFYKTVSTYTNGQAVSHFIDRKTIMLRRTSNSDLGPSKIKLRLVERRRDDSPSCNVATADEISGDNIETDDTDRLQRDDDDECDNENGVKDPERLHGRDCDQKHPEHIDIRHNITQINTEDEMECSLANDDGKNNDSRVAYRSEQTFHAEPRTATSRDQNIDSRTNLGNRSHTDLTDKHTKVNNPTCIGKNKVKESWTSTKDETKSGDNNVKSCAKRADRKKTVDCNKDSGMESDDSLDIPEDRYGPTTHSIDRKLAIRKPWEWRPCPYRWIDRSFVKESDKPYIERIINSGEIIDEFNYDAFARTKPLKLHDFPEGAGYKDRSGVLR